MDTVEIFLMVFVFLFAGFRLYQKYFKKDSEQMKSNKPSSGGSQFSSFSKDDDYEPYSKK